MSEPALSEPAFQVTGHASVLYVKDMAASLAYYRDKLGFTVRFSWEDPPRYACLSLGEAAVHLNSYLPPAATAVVCIFCTGVDALHDALAARGAAISSGLTTHPYGMRDFIVTDPDGHQLIIGQGTGE
jgi:catechol 2,3-dioxygenase-like lactoylglutathione lyase family enzyme